MMERSVASQLIVGEIGSIGGRGILGMERDGKRKLLDRTQSVTNGHGGGRSRLKSPVVDAVLLTR